MREKEEGDMRIEGERLGEIEGGSIQRKRIEGYQ